MLLVEYKSKELLAQYGLNVPAGKRARTAEEAEAACASLNARKYVVKAQIAAGGRGLAEVIQQLLALKGGQGAHGRVSPGRFLRRAGSAHQSRQR